MILRRMWQLRKSLATKKFRNAGYEALFDESKTAHPPDLIDLWWIVEELRRQKPKLVLEYGSGYSTYVIAETLRRLGCGRLISVELSENWRRLSDSRLGPARDVVEFAAPRPEVALCGGAPSPDCGPIWFRTGSRTEPLLGIATIAFPELHRLHPDVIVIDGPSKRQVPGYVDALTGKPFDAIVSDPLFMHGPFTIIVDSRPNQCAFLAANLRPHYTWKRREREKFTILRPSKQSSPFAR